MSYTDEAEKAWKRLSTKHTREDWIILGRALVEGQQEAMRQAKTNRPFGPDYRRIFGAWLQKYSFGNIRGDTRSLLVKVMENLSEIERWLKTIDPKLAAKLNSPKAILRRWVGSVPKVERSIRISRKRDGESASGSREKDDDKEEEESSEQDRLFEIHQEKAEKILDMLMPFSDERADEILKIVNDWRVRSKELKKERMKKKSIS